MMRNERRPDMNNEHSWCLQNMLKGSTPDLCKWQTIVLLPQTKPRQGVSPLYRRPWHVVCVANVKMAIDVQKLPRVRRRETDHTYDGYILDGDEAGVAEVTMQSSFSTILSYVL